MGNKEFGILKIHRILVVSKDTAWGQEAKNQSGKEEKRYDRGKGISSRGEGEFEWGRCLIRKKDSGVRPGRKGRTRCLAWGNSLDGRG